MKTFHQCNFREVMSVQRIPTNSYGRIDDSGRNCLRVLGEGKKQQQQLGFFLSAGNQKTLSVPAERNSIKAQGPRLIIVTY